MSGRRRTPSPSGSFEIVVEAAWLYYNEGLNQNEIARRLSVSRASVVNYLQEGRERGLIRIRLADEPFLAHSLSLDLQRRFGLKAAYVVPAASPADDTATLLRVAKAAGNWLPSLLQAGDTLGVAWGRTIYELAEGMEPEPVPDVSVVQLTGSMATPYGFTAELCSARLAQRLNGRCINLHAPAILSTPELAAALRQEPLIRDQLHALGDCNKALFAAGSCTTESHVVLAGIATAADIAEYRARGARAVLCGRFVDAQGAHVAGALDERMIGITPERMQDLEMGLLVSCGPDKVEPMAAVLRGGYASHLVTDNVTAQALLAEG